MNHVPPSWDSAGSGISGEHASTSIGDIQASQNDGVFFQNVNATSEQQRRDSTTIELARQASSISYSIPSNCGSMSFISQPTPGPPRTYPQPIFRFHPFHAQSSLPILIQRPYQSGLALDPPRTMPPICYYAFGLSDALAEDYSGLQGSDQLAWSKDISLPTKLAMVLWLPEYPRYKHQVKVLRAHNLPPTRGGLARIVAREMKRFLDKAQTEYRRPLRWHGRELTLSDLFLLNIRQVSRGSLQPCIGVREPVGRPGTGLAPRMNLVFPIPGAT